MSQSYSAIATKNTMIKKPKKPKNIMFAVYLTQLRLKLPLRKNRPVFKKEVAIEAGINISSYSMAESGVIPGDSVLYRLSQYFNVPVDNFKNKQIDHVPKAAAPFRETKSELQDGQAQGPLLAAIVGLSEVFNSNDPILIPTIQAKIHAFQLSARREHQNAQQARQIKALQDECDELKKRFDALEKTCQNFSPGPAEATTERKVI